MTDATSGTPDLNRQVWIQAGGRFLYQAGTALIQFYLPLIFVNQVGISATAVGIAVGCGALAGVAGHFLGGYLTDRPSWGRKRTLLLSAWLAILGAAVLPATHTLAFLIDANLLLGFSAGCYWTAAEAAVMDETTPAQRHHAFSVMSLSDGVGCGVGILFGGALMNWVDRSQDLFLIGGAILLGYWALTQFAVVSHPKSTGHAETLEGFVVAFRDRALRLFVVINILFTTMIAMVNITLPLYFTDVIQMASGDDSMSNIANLFTWGYIGVGAVLQIPLVRLVRGLLPAQILMVSLLLWAAGFFLVWATSAISVLQVVCMLAALSVLAIATCIYKPIAPTIVGDLAPHSLRGVYVAISYQCWSIGYFVGPIFGGWALDQSATITRFVWLGVAASTVIGLLLLQRLDHQRPDYQRSDRQDQPVPVSSKASS